jgi:uncharacterized protein
MAWDQLNFKEKLEENHQFPGDYMFKFIVPSEKKQALIDLLPDGELVIKNSSSNRFMSITLNIVIESSDKVIEIYNKAYVIEGLIAI